MRGEDSTAPGHIRRDVRPPIPPDSAPQPGAVGGPGPDEVYDVRAQLRRTVWPRPVVSPRIWHHDEPGHPAASRYVRTFWTAALGPGAVADLLRLATAATRGRSLRRPLGLSILCEAGLAREVGGHLEVRTVVPPVPGRTLRSLHPAVRRLHEEDHWRDEMKPPSAA